MKNENNLEFLMNEMNKLLDFVKKNKDRPLESLKMPDNIEASLNQLSKDVDAYVNLNEEIVKQCNIPEEEFKMALQGVLKDIPEESKDLLNKINTIKLETQNLYEEFNDKFKKIAKESNLIEDPILENSVLETVKERDLTEKEQQKKRKNKFKKVGGNNKWKAN